MTDKFSLCKMFKEVVESNSLNGARILGLDAQIPSLDAFMNDTKSVKTLFTDLEIDKMSLGEVSTMLSLYKEKGIIFGNAFVFIFINF